MPAIDSRGVALRDFWQIVRALSREAFLSEYPHPFLLELTEAPSQSLQDFQTVHDAAASQLSGPGDPDQSISGASRAFGVCKTTGVFAGKITVGRSQNNDLVLNQAAVSKLHAYFTSDGDEWTLVDAESSNGTFVRGERLPPLSKAVLANRDQVGFGRHARFVFVTAAHFQRRIRFFMRQQGGSP